MLESFFMLFTTLNLWKFIVILGMIVFFISGYKAFEYVINNIADIVDDVVFRLSEK